MNLRRREMLKLVAGGASTFMPFAPSLAASGVRLILLGTKGGPRVGTGRYNPAHVLVINDIPYVIDCGYGVAHQLVTAKIALPSIRNIFVTHLHSDHVLEFGPLVYGAWAAGLKQPVNAYGPRGLSALANAFWESMRFDVETRIPDEGKPDPRKLLNVTDLNEPGTVLKNESVHVTAFKTPHPPILEENFAYKFETAGATIVFSGDTAYNPALAEFAKGADVLVHEALYVPGIEAMVARVPNAATLRDHLIASHTSTEDVGRIAAAAGVKRVVLTHLVPGDDDTITDAMWSEGVRKHFAGEIVVGRDLMAFDLMR